MLILEELVDQKIIQATLEEAISILEVLEDQKIIRETLEEVISILEELVDQKIIMEIPVELILILEEWEQIRFPCQSPQQTDNRLCIIQYQQLLPAFLQVRSMP